MTDVLILWILVATAHLLHRMFEAGVTILRGPHLGRMHHSTLNLTEGTQLLISGTRSIGGVIGTELPMMTSPVRQHGDPMTERLKENDMIATPHHHREEVLGGTHVIMIAEPRSPVPLVVVLLIPPVH